MNSGSYDRFKLVWETQKEAEDYRRERFSRSRRWRWTGLQEQTIVSQFIRALPEGSRVMDIPCGAGRFVPLFHDAKIRYLGVDYAFSMVQLAKGAPRSPHLLNGDALRLPLRDKAVDAAICVRLLHRIHERSIRVRMLGEIARVVRGPVLATYYLRWNLRGIQRWWRGKHPGLSLPQVRGDIQAAGLHLDRATPLRRWTQQEWFFQLRRS